MSAKSEQPEKTEDGDEVRNRDFEIEIKIEPTDSVTEGMQPISTHGTSTEPPKKKLDVPARKCNFSCLKFSTVVKFKTHMLQHSMEKKYTCTTCKRRYLNKEKLGTHLLRHTDVQCLLCKICGRKLTDNTILENHMFIHSCEEYTCDLCDETFPNKTKLTVHTRKHKGGNVYTCSYCEKEFESPSGLRAHERTHSGVKPYSCEICKQSYTRLSKLYRHMREHGGSKPQKCAYCEKRFVRGQDLERHAMTHEGYDDDM